MQSFEFHDTTISGLMLITPFLAPDDRGYFSKPFEKRIFAEHGIELSPYEELRSYSHKGVLRGLHFQREHSQDKLVQVLVGAAYDVAVDLREGSPTFGKWEGFELTAKKLRALYIPGGFAHGFLAMEEGTLFSYLCGGQYDPKTESGIIWNDKELNIQWPLKENEMPLLSQRDMKFSSFNDFKCQLKGSLGGKVNG